MAAYLFDSAVVAVGTVIENALDERVPVMGKKYETAAKYTLAQLLDPAFTLPRPPRSPRRMTGPQTAAQQAGVSAPLAQVIAMAGQQHSRVKKFAYIGPPQGQVN